MGSLVCRVELHKKNGIIITVENNDDNITQTMVLDGTTITTTNAGADETSVITQATDSITIKCKDFLLDADTITCKSTGAAVHESKDTFKIKSSKDMSFNSGADLKADATSDMKLSAKEIDASTTSGDVKISGTNVNVTAKMKAGIDSKNLDLKGSISAKVDGGIVDVTGKKTNVAGSALTTIGGTIIKIG